jgi:uncharacterized protein YraI
MKSLIATLITASAFAIALPAFADPGFVNTKVNVRAGPGIDFPRVGLLPPGARVDVRECVPQLDWCDVAWRSGRGWISARYLDILVDGRRGGLWDNRTRSSIPMRPWNFDQYWNDNYRGRDFYRQRDKFRSRGPGLGPDGPGPGYGPGGPGPGNGPGPDYSPEGAGPGADRGQSGKGPPLRCPPVRNLDRGSVTPTDNKTSEAGGNAAGAGAAPSVNFA